MEDIILGEIIDRAMKIGFDCAIDSVLQLLKSNIDKEQIFQVVLSLKYEI